MWKSPRVASDDGVGKELFNLYFTDHLTDTLTFIILTCKHCAWQKAIVPNKYLLNDNPEHY